MPMGTLTKKIQRHEKLEMMIPPSTGPRIGPRSVGTPITRHDLVHLVGACGAGHDRLPDRHDHAATQPLQDAEA